MGHYHFDQIIDRTNTNSIKHTFDESKGKTPDMVPLWVADMDFRSPDEVIDRIRERCEHGIFGYTRVSGEYLNAVQGWFERRFGWKTESEWMVRTPGVVYAVSAAISALTEKGDAVLIQSPVYYPFARSIEAAERRTVRSSLLFDGRRYTIDFDEFEKKIVEEKVKLFILCSPHNPVGRVWTKAELARMGEICLKHNVYVVSDEIHCDFVWKGFVHTPFATVSEEMRDISITCTAPSKTFNLAGMKTSNIFIPNPEIREKFKGVLSSWHCGEPAIFGLTACQAAYEGGREWLEQLKEYLKGNLDFVRNYLKENIPQIKLIEPEGTYLVWLDCRELGLSEKELEQFIAQKAKLWLDDGIIFGKAGEGFERVNIACPRATLKEALERLKKAAATLTV